MNRAPDRRPSASLLKGHSRQPSGDRAKNLQARSGFKWRDRAVPTFNRRTLKRSRSPFLPSPFRFRLIRSKKPDGSDSRTRLRTRDVRGGQLNRCGDGGAFAGGNAEIVSPLASAPVRGHIPQPLSAGGGTTVTSHLPAGPFETGEGAASPQGGHLLCFFPLSDHGPHPKHRNHRTR